ncbi:MAG: ribosome biogenesis GTPase Der [Spirochaetales bacterium]|nr:ribosome biogenesis GTPase Der [Spirochaetales bacterium]
MNDSISSPIKSSRPLVVIAGRPNVGKSTLFNRLTRARKAITDPTPGVTRDAVEGCWNLDGRNLTLVDTGGYRIDGESLDRMVSDRSLAKAAGADVIILLLDAEETTPEDEIFLEALRKYRDRIVLAVNKVDNPQREADVWNFHRYGFPKVVGISASHGLGIDELSEAVQELLPEDVRDAPEPPQADRYIRIAVLGKPNTGKSTLLNTLLGTEKSLVTDIPGTTRDVVEGTLTRGKTTFLILDTAGIRRKNKVTEAVEYYSVHRAIKSIEGADIVFLVVDVLEGLSEQDKKIAAHAVKHGKGIIIVLNKWDLVEDLPNRKAAETDRVRFLFPVLHFAPVVFLSALKGKGLENLFSETEKIWRQLHKTVDTPSLNKLLAGAVEAHRPRGKQRYRTKYITQSGTNPLRFILFVNKKEGFPKTWVNYLINQIREEFTLKDVPILLELRE